jgi:ABC-type multidrug transport system ATPase subunit
MKVSLTDAGKRFNRDWIFRHLTYTFEEGNWYAIIGPNGSGKSTLLQILSGAMQASEGNVCWSMGNARPLASAGTHGDDTRLNDSPDSYRDRDWQAVGGGDLSIEKIFDYVAICAPYLEVVEEMTLKEFLKFHHGFKPFLSSLSIENIISRIGLQEAANKQIRYFSSGMRQRVKLAQAIFSDTPFLLLDEPCTNLDTSGIRLYLQLIDEFCKSRLVIVSSNDEVEYKFCQERINIADYKK